MGRMDATLFVQPAQQIRVIREIKMCYSLKNGLHGRYIICSPNPANGL